MRLLTPRRLRRWWWKLKRLSFGEVLTAAVFTAIGGAAVAVALGDPGGPDGCAPGVVTNVVDGDTIDVGACRIRLLAVDTPETQWRSRGTPWCSDYALGHEAARVVGSLTLGQHVTYGATEDDSSGRDMAAEVYLPGGTELGQWLVAAGLAVPWPADTPATACPPGSEAYGMEPSR